MVRNLLIHYRGGGIEFTGDRLEEINHRWVDAMLATDQRRNGTPLATPANRSTASSAAAGTTPADVVSALRHKGIPARSRVGFGDYFADGFNHDHVVVEYWNGDRWVMFDAQMEPAEHRGFDVHDMPPRAVPIGGGGVAGRSAPATSTATCSARPRRCPVRGGWFIRDYVFLQLAHLQGDELLLWDGWGEMADDLRRRPHPDRRIAALLVASDAGDETATKPTR